MRVTVISPERSVFDGEAQAVTAPAYDGSVGILPRHAPFMTLLGEGTLRVKDKDRFHDALYRSPFMDEFTLRLATEIVTRFDLGMDDAPDLLCIGLYVISDEGTDGMPFGQVGDTRPPILTG